MYLKFSHWQSDARKRIQHSQHFFVVVDASDENKMIIVHSRIQTTLDQQILQHFEMIPFGSFLTINKLGRKKEENANYLDSVVIPTCNIDSLILEQVLYDMQVAILHCQTHS
jgi:hypothetical protein